MPLKVSEIIFEVLDAPFEALKTPGKTLAGTGPASDKEDKTGLATNRLPVAISQIYKHLAHSTKHLFTFYFLYKTKLAKYPVAWVAPGAGTRAVGQAAVSSLGPRPARGPCFSVMPELT